MLDAIGLPEPLPSLGTDAPAPSAARGDAGKDSNGANDPSLAEPTVDAEESAKPAAAPSAQKPAGAPGKPAANSVYLSDKELLKLQSATDEGEVAE